jgi:aspartate/methionine/tyrosine aminotransferase
VIYDIYSTFLNPNDEVIVFEPFFEVHLKEARMLGAKIVTTDFIEPKEFGTHPWTINFEELEGLFNERTRMIVLNSPHNPTGKIFTREELERIVKILEKFPKVLVLSDDVYETLVFDQREYVRIATLPGMFERTISTYSLGKMFSATGWRVGFCIGPDNLIKLVRAAHAIISYCVHRPS